MNSAKRTRDNPKLNSSVSSSKENADPIWNVENELLKSEAEANSRLRQQINKQSYADNAVQTDIKSKIASLKQKAVTIAKSLEAEKRKNIELQAIIRHMNSLRQQQRRLQSTSRDDANFENLDSLARKIKKLQYDLQQMYSKLNDINAKNKERKHEVDTFRTQRVIDSGIFLKIQKQIIDQETEYKKLLIQKITFEQQYHRILNKYKSIKTDIEKQQDANTKRSNISKSENKQEQFFINIPEIEHAVKFTQVNQYDKRNRIQSKRHTFSVQTQKSQQKEEKQIMVKKIFTQTGLNNVTTLINYLNNIDTINNDLFQQTNKDTDRIAELNRQIANLKQIRNKKTIKYYEGEPALTKAEIKFKQAQAVQVQINKVQGNTWATIKNLQHILKSTEMKELIKMVNAKLQFEDKIEYLQSLFSQLESHITPILLSAPLQEKDKCLALPVSKTENKQESLDELINKIRRISESEKIMNKEDFQKEYENIRKSQQNKSRMGNKKATLRKVH